jgi:hypothetical protein
VPVGEPIRLAHEFIRNFIAHGNDGAQLEAEIFNIVAHPLRIRATDFEKKRQSTGARLAFDDVRECLRTSDWMAQG